MFPFLHHPLARLNQGDMSELTHQVPCHGTPRAVRQVPLASQVRRSNHPPPRTQAWPHATSCKRFITKRGQHPRLVSSDRDVTLQGAILHPNIHAEWSRPCHHLSSTAQTHAPALSHQLAAPNEAVRFSVAVERRRCLASVNVLDASNAFCLAAPVFATALRQTTQSSRPPPNPMCPVGVRGDNALPPFGSPLRPSGPKPLEIGPDAFHLRGVDQPNALLVQLHRDVRHGSPDRLPITMTGILEFEEFEV